MQHDVNYSVCGNKPKSEQVKCKNEADKKIVKALDAIPWKDRQGVMLCQEQCLILNKNLEWGQKT